MDHQRGIDPNAFQSQQAQQGFGSRPRRARGTLSCLSCCLTTLLCLGLASQMGIEGRQGPPPSPALNRLLKPFGLTRTVYDGVKAIKQPRPHGLVIDGKALAVALRPSVLRIFLEVGLRCQGVVCCRVSPLQKALVTGAVKNMANKASFGLHSGTSAALLEGCCNQGRACSAADCNARPRWMWTLPLIGRSTRRLCAGDPGYRRRCQ